MSEEVENAQAELDRKALEAFVVENEDLQRLEAVLGQFNIFEAIGVVRQEVQHSDFWLSAQERPSPKGDDHAFWTEDVLDGLGLERAPLVGLSYGAAIAIRTMGVAPERITRAALVSPPA